MAPLSAVTVCGGGGVVVALVPFVLFGERLRSQRRLAVSDTIGVVRFITVDVVVTGTGRHLGVWIFMSIRDMFKAYFDSRRTTTNSESLV